jgi:hypothetical protein
VPAQLTGRHWNIIYLLQLFHGSITLLSIAAWKACHRVQLTSELSSCSQAGVSRKGLTLVARAAAKTVKGKAAKSSAMVCVDW